MKRIYHWFQAIFKRKHVPMARHVSDLPADILAKIHQETQFLRATHAVKVHALAEGEEAGKPRAVDPAVEASLPFIVPEKPAP